MQNYKSQTSDILMAYNYFIYNNNRGFSRDVTAAKSCKSRYSQPLCWIFFCTVRIGKSNEICFHSLLLNLHKAKLYRSNNVINIYSLTASLTCSNKISKKLKHILLFFLGFSYTAPRQKISNMASARSAHGVRTASWKPSIWHYAPPVVRAIAKFEFYQKVTKRGQKKKNWLFFF